MVSLIRAVQTSYFVALLNRTSCRGNVFQMEFSYISTEGGTHTLLYDDYDNVGLCVVLGLGIPRLVARLLPTQAHILVQRMTVFILFNNFTRKLSYFMHPMGST